MKRMEKLVGAFLAAGLFGALAVGTTLALYQTEKTVNNHISTGGMDAALYLVELKNDVLENDGTISPYVAVDLSQYEGYETGISYVDHDTSAQGTYVAGVNLGVYAGEVFAVDHVVPTMKGSAKFLIHNYAATDAQDAVAFSFSVAMTAPEGDDPLIEQVDISLSDATWDNNPVLSGEGKVFSVNWEFKDDDDNNDAQDQSLTFDISVTCTQIIRA